MCVKVPLQRPSSQNTLLDKTAKTKFLWFITWKKHVQFYLLGIRNLRQKPAKSYQTGQEYNEIPFFFLSFFF